MSARINIKQEKSADGAENCIADGLYEDCLTLIQSYQQQDTLRFREFTKLWNQSKFHLVFSGRPSKAELREFAAEAMEIAGRFIFSTEGGDKDDENQIRIAGVYLAYCLFNVHPIVKNAPIRVDQSRAIILNQLKRFATDFGHIDFLYILCSMLRDGIFRFVATVDYYGTGNPFKKYNNPKSNEEIFNSDHVTNLLEDSILDEVTAALGDYHTLKCNLSGVNSINPPKELDYIDPNYAASLKRSLQDLMFSQCSKSSDNKPSKEILNEKEQLPKESSLSTLALANSVKCDWEEEPQTKSNLQYDDDEDMPDISLI